MRKYYIDCIVCLVLYNVQYVYYVHEPITVHCRQGMEEVKDDSCNSTLAIYQCYYISNMLHSCKSSSENIQKTRRKQNMQFN